MNAITLEGGATQINIGVSGITLGLLSPRFITLSPSGDIVGPVRLPAVRNVDGPGRWILRNMHTSAVSILDNESSSVGSIAAGGWVELGAVNGRWIVVRSS